MTHESNDSRCDEGSARDFAWSADHRMLVEIRDTLYEGSWNDFIEDLQAKAERRPRAFETVPDSPRMRETIADHLRLIEQIRGWEDKTGVLTGPDGAEVSPGAKGQTEHTI